MAEILNQEEINALMDAFRVSGAQESSSKSEHRVRIYDFARPDKFSKEHLRSLNTIHGKHGAAFGAALSALLRIQTRVELLALDQLTYREYCASVPDNTLFVRVDLEHLAAMSVFEFNPLFVTICVNALAGGPATTSAQQPRITEIDQAIFRPVIDLALKQYVDSWSSCVAIKPKVIGTSTEVSDRQIYLPTEAVLVCVYEVSVGENVSMMSICLPAAAVEPILPALTVGRTLAPTRGYDKVDPALMKTFEGVELECRAVLGGAVLPIEEVVGLEVGDVVRLPTKSNGLAELWVGNVAAFTGTLGLSGRNLAMKLAKPILESDTKTK